jgi:hypothetical protein
MPRPPFELRAMEEEERRRARAHRRLRRADRLRRGLRVSGGIAFFVLGLLLLRLTGLLG